MKDNQEFLRSMWTAIHEIEYEEDQKQLVIERSRSVARKNLFLYLSVLCASAVTVLFSIHIEKTYSGAVYGMAFILLMLAYFLDHIYFSSTRRTETK